MGKHTRHGVPIDYCPDRARHRAKTVTGSPVMLDGRDITATIARVDATYSAARVALERATLEAEYRGLGIDPALIDIIEASEERQADAILDGMIERHVNARCSVEPYLETIEANVREELAARPVARSAADLRAKGPDGVPVYRVDFSEPPDRGGE